MKEVGHAHVCTLSVPPEEAGVAVGSRIEQSQEYLASSLRKGPVMEVCERVHMIQFFQFSLQKDGLYFCILQRLSD